MVNELKKGDILFSHIFTYDNIIPGYWTHQGIIIGFDENNIAKVIESTTSGVRIVDLNFFLTRGSVGIGRLDLNDSQIQTVIDWAKSKLDYEFDWQWLTKNDDNKYYCSELIWLAYKQIGIDLDSNPGFNWKYIYSVSPQEIYDSNNVNIVGLLKN